MITKIISSGCSFTEGHTLGKDFSFPKYLSQSFNAEDINIAQGGRGNFYISNSIIGELLNHKDDWENILVVAGWSEATRQECFLSTIEEPPKSITIRTVDFLIDLNEIKEPYVSKNRRVLQNIFSDFSYAFYKSYISILSLKNFCDVNKIKYIFLDSVIDNKIYKSDKNSFEVKKVASSDELMNEPSLDFYNILNKNTSDYIFDKKYIDIFGYCSINDWMMRDDMFYFNELTENNQGHPNEKAAKQIAEHIKTKFNEIYN